jgi:hypothetical protein
MYLCTALEKGYKKQREFSSAGSEHLPYKQRVGGSNPSTPTKVFIYEDLFYLIMVRVYFIFRTCLSADRQVRNIKNSGIISVTKSR